MPASTEAPSLLAVSAPVVAYIALIATLGLGAAVYRLRVRLNSLDRDLKKELHEDRKEFDAEQDSRQQWREATQPILDALADQRVEVRTTIIEMIPVARLAPIDDQLRGKPDKKTFAALAIAYANVIRDAAREVEGMPAGGVIANPEEKYTEEGQAQIIKAILELRDFLLDPERYAANKNAPAGTGAEADQG